MEAQQLISPEILLQIKEWTEHFEIIIKSNDSDIDIDLEVLTINIAPIKLKTYFEEIGYFFDISYEADDYGEVVIEFFVFKEENPNYVISVQLDMLTLRVSLIGRYRYSTDFKNI
jgi:hypothetical protein